MRDVVVVGAGPAGRALFAACAGAGLRSTLVDPSPDARWHQNYGAWVDELEVAGLGGCAGQRWSEAVVDLGHEGRRVLPRAYARLDNARLAGELGARAHRAGGEEVVGRVIGVEHGPERSVVHLEGGRRLEARLVADASGAGSPLVAREAGPAPGVQVAHGILAEVRGAPWDPAAVTLMDFSDDHLADDPAASRHASFLYAMPLADGRVFLEETSLVARPALDPAVLERRLALRLARLGVEVRRVHEVERCWIPMGGPRPLPGQRVLAFGAAGGLVHPATGYMVMLALRDAPRVASALVEALGRGPVLDATSLAWPQDRRRTYALLRFGMEALLDLDAAGTRRFFAAFFALPPPAWEGYLGATLGPGALAAVMLAVFRRLPAALELRLVAHSLGPARASLLEAAGLG